MALAKDEHSERFPPEDHPSNHLLIHSSTHPHIHASSCTIPKGSHPAAPSFLMAAPDLVDDAFPKTLLSDTLTQAMRFINPQKQPKGKGSKCAFRDPRRLPNIRPVRLSDFHVPFSCNLPCQCLGWEEKAEGETRPPCSCASSFNFFDNDCDCSCDYDRDRVQKETRFQSFLQPAFGPVTSSRISFMVLVPFFHRFPCRLTPSKYNKRPKKGCHRVQPSLCCPDLFAC